MQAAVESKQVAQQNAQRAALIVEKAKQERQQKIVEAEGEAQSALLIGKASANWCASCNVIRAVRAAKPWVLASPKD